MEEERLVRSTRTLLVVFVNIHMVVHCEFTIPDPTVKAEFYCNVLRFLGENIWCEGMPVLQYAVCLVIMWHRFFSHNNTIVPPHLPYWPNYAPCDDVVFPKIKFKLKGCHYDTV